MKKITILPAFLFIFVLTFQSYSQETKNYASNMVKKPHKT